MKRFFVLLTLFSFFYNLSVHANTASTSFSSTELLQPMQTRLFGLNDLDEDPFLFFGFDNNLEDLLELSSSSVTRQTKPGDIVALLIEQADILEILQEPFYLETNQLNRRSLLDEPIFDQHRCIIPGKEGIFWSINLFAAKMARGNFTKNSTNLCSYIALSEPSLISKLENVVDRIKVLFEDPAFNIDIQKIFKLFKHMTVEERRAGAMITAGRFWKQSRFRALIPFYYLEQNFSLTLAERQAVEDEFGALDPEEQEEFQSQHFISDKLGLGDLRLELDTVLCKKPFSTLYWGIEATIPTAFPLINGLKGRDFPKPCFFPTFSFTQLFDLAINPDKANDMQAFDIIRDFLLGALDRAAANLLDAPLGNGGHFGIGAYMILQTPATRWISHPWFEHISLENRIELQYLFSGYEKRFFINRIHPELFDPALFIDPNNPDTDPALAEANLIFLQDQFVERIYLRAFSVKIHPRPIFRYTGTICYTGEEWMWTIGNDTWLQGSDGISHIKNKVIDEEVCFSKVFPPIAYQAKLIGSITYQYIKPEETWLFSLSGSGTVSNRGIGSDWFVVLSVEQLF